MYSEIVNQGHLAGDHGQHRNSDLCLTDKQNNNTSIR